MSSPLGCVLEGKRDSSPLLDLDRLALGIQNESFRGLGFSDDHTFYREPSPRCGSHRSHRCGRQRWSPRSKCHRHRHDLKLRILESHAGIDITNLANEQVAIRHILKWDGDDTLLTAVCQIDGFGRLDDGVAICRVHFLQNIGAAFEPGPNSGAVFPGPLWPIIVPPVPDVPPR